MSQGETVLTKEQRAMLGLPEPNYPSDSGPFVALQTTPSSQPTKIISKTASIEWIGGLPVPVDAQIIDIKALKQLSTVALSTKYRGKPVEDDDGGRISYHMDPKYSGLSNAEVIFLRASEEAAGGDINFMKLILDRSMGKVVQETITKQIEGTYADFLEMAGEDSSHLTNDLASMPMKMKESK